MKQFNMKSKTFFAKAALMLLATLFSLTGARAQKNLPYEYGFETDFATEGWTKVNQGTTNNGNELGITAEAAQNGSYGFRFSSYYDQNASSFNQYLISPELNVTSWGVNVQFSYRASSTNTSYGPERFKVGYSTTNTDLSSFIFGDEVQTNSTSWTLYKATFPVGTKYVAVFYYSNYVYRLYVDDFEFKEGGITINGDREFDDKTHVTITCDVEGATILYSTDDGTSWNTYPSEGFDLDKTATVTAKATKEGLLDSDEVSEFFLKSSDKANFMWDLTSNPSTYTTVTGTTQVDWVCTGATMTLAKGSSNTNANNYLGGITTEWWQTVNHTRMYNGQTLTFEPVEGYAISSIVITSTSNSYGSTLNNNMTVTNATKTRNGSEVTITPIDGEASIVARFSGEVRIAGVTVNYYATSSPFIAIAVTNKEINESSATVPTTTLETSYNRVSNSNAAVVLYDENNNVVNGNTCNGITVSLDADKNLTYSVTANTTTTARKVYVKVTAGGISSPVIAIIQAAAYVLADGFGADNTTLINSHSGEECCVILDSRTFTTGKWYTLCLPFDVNLKAAGCPLAGADARGLAEDNTKTRIEGKTLKLEFTPVDVLEAGVPYIIRWESNAPTNYPIAFTDVTIVPEENPATCDLDESKSVYFKGTYKFTTYTAVDKSMLFISNNTFYYVGVNTTIGAQRGYFQLNGFSYDPSSTSNGVKEFGITFDDDPDGINDVNVNLNDNESIYNVAGLRIGKMQNGINIVNGKKIFVK